MPIDLLRGDSLVWTVEFFTDEAGTVPWADLADYNPRVQVRPDTEAPDLQALTPTATVDGNLLTLALTSSQSSGLRQGSTYVWDVQLTDPTAAEGLGEFTYPPAGEPRGQIEVGPDVTRISA